MQKLTYVATYVANKEKLTVSTKVTISYRALKMTNIKAKHI
jgi:hypothetical protein